MAKIHSEVTELPASCKSAAEHMAAELAGEDAYADLSEECIGKLTRLEAEIGKEIGEPVALVACRLS